MNFENFSVNACKKIIDNEEVFILDVRTVGECASGMIESAVNIPLDELEDRFEEVSKDKKVLVYCASGNRSQIACNILASHDLQNNVNMEGGIFAWRREGFSVI